MIVLYTNDDERLADLAYDFEVIELANASYCLHNSELDSESEVEEEEEGGRMDGTRKRRRMSSEDEEEPGS